MSDAASLSAAKVVLPTSQLQRYLCAAAVSKSFDQTSACPAYPNSAGSRVLTLRAPKPAPSLIPSVVTPLGNFKGYPLGQPRSPRPVLFAGMSTPILRGALSVPSHLLEPSQLLAATVSVGRSVMWRSIADSSLQKYATGWRKWVEFTAKIGTNWDLSNKPPNVETILDGFSWPEACVIGFLVFTLQRKWSGGTPDSMWIFIGGTICDAVPTHRYFIYRSFHRDCAL